MLTQAHDGYRQLEVDAHYDPTEGRPTDLGKPGSGKDAAAADMKLPPGDLLPGLRDHRIALESTGAASPREVGGSVRKRTAYAATPETRAGDEAGHGPDAVVGLVFRSVRPGNAGVQQAHVGGARLDRAPAGWLPIEVGDEAAGYVRLGLTAGGLLAQPVGAFFVVHRAPLGVSDLETLAVAMGPMAPGRAEDKVQVLPGRLVGGNDRDPRRLNTATLCFGGRHTRILGRDSRLASCLSG